MRPLETGPIVTRPSCWVLVSSSLCENRVRIVCLLKEK